MSRENVAGRVLRPHMAGAGAALFLFAGCGAGPPVRIPGLSGTCPDPGNGTVILWNETRSLKRGQTMVLMPFASDHPGSADPLPSRCLEDVRLSVPEAGTIAVTEEGDTELRISEDAPFGQPVTVRARYRDNATSGRFAVYDPETMPLVGYWRQIEDGCDPDSVIRELIFAADGSFSVTWTPFETYRDYWGAYRFDPETGQLSLEPDSQNMSIEGIRSGRVSVSEGRLVPETASFGQYPDMPPCENGFE